VVFEVVDMEDAVADPPRPAAALKRALRGIASGGAIDKALQSPLAGALPGAEGGVSQSCGGHRDYVQTTLTKASAFMAAGMWKGAV
jgi:hypothetical protein